jgi:hypothetical protein
MIPGPVAGRVAGPATPGNPRPRAHHPALTGRAVCPAAMAGAGALAWQPGGARVPGGARAVHGEGQRQAGLTFQVNVAVPVAPEAFLAVTVTL